MKTSLIILCVLFSVKLFSAEKNKSGSAHALDRVIEHQKQGVKITKASKASSTEDELTKLFDLILVEQEKEIKRMEELRSKIFPEITKLEAETPKVEINEGVATYDVRAELPGMVKDDVRVSLEGDELIITGNRKNQMKKTSEGKTITEFSYGEFERKIYLDHKVNPKSLNVEFKDGIINVHLDKIHADKTKA